MLLLGQAKSKVYPKLHISNIFKPPLSPLQKGEKPFHFRVILSLPVGRQAKAKDLIDERPLINYLDITDFEAPHQQDPSEVTSG